jgi:hypothetical protein
MAFVAPVPEADRCSPPLSFVNGRAEAQGDELRVTPPFGQEKQMGDHSNGTNTLYVAELSPRRSEGLTAAPPHRCSWERGLAQA